MHKTLTIFQDISDMQGFESFITNEVMPRLLAVPGIVHMEITSMGPAVESTPVNQLSIQFILTIYFESMKAQEDLLGTQEGVELAGIVQNNPYGKVGIFMCREKVFYTTPTFLSNFNPQLVLESNTDARLDRLELGMQEIMKILKGI